MSFASLFRREILGFSLPRSDHLQWVSLMALAEGQI